MSNKTTYEAPNVVKSYLVLGDLGYKNIRVFSLTTGKEITNASELDTITDLWFYFLCNF